MMQISNTNFQYAESSEGVQNINLTIQTGQCVVLIGPSGGGKITISRILNRLIPAYYDGKLTGEVLLNNENLQNYTNYEIASEIGSVFQDPKSQFFFFRFKR